MVLLLVEVVRTIQKVCARILLCSNLLEMTLLYEITQARSQLYIRYDEGRSERRRRIVAS